MAEGLDADEEEEAGASPAGSQPAELYSHDSDANAEAQRQRCVALPQPVSQAADKASGRQQDAAARQLEQEIAQALAADAAFLEDPSLSLREGALQPLLADQDQGYELPALSAGGTISKVSHLSAPQRPAIHLPWWYTRASTFNQSSCCQLNQLLNQVCTA